MCKKELAQSKEKQEKQDKEVQKLKKEVFNLQNRLRTG